MNLQHKSRYAHGVRFVYFCALLPVESILSITSRIILLALGQTYDCASASEAIFKHQMAADDNIDDVMQDCGNYIAETLTSNHLKPRVVIIPNFSSLVAFAMS